MKTSRAGTMGPGGCTGSKAGYQTGAGMDADSDSIADFTL